MIKLPEHIVFFAEGEELLNLHSLTLHLIISLLKFFIQLPSFVLPLLVYVLDFGFQVDGLLLLLLLLIVKDLLRLLGLLFHFDILFVVF